LTEISSYWNWKVQRWDALIMQEAGRRRLDPDLLASLVWMESRGIPDAVGPVGAVGLMQIMPKEAGFTWRPTQEALLDPETNLFWGTRTLATVIHQGQGDVFHALAAYNGGWDRVGNRGPTRFATTVLRDYVQAVAARYDLEPDTWAAFFAVDTSSSDKLRGPIWVADTVHEDIYFYSHDNEMPNGTALIPDIPPAAVVARCGGEGPEGAYSVGVWIYRMDTHTWINGDATAVLDAAAMALSDPVPATPGPIPTAHPTVGGGFVAASSTPIVMSTATAFSDADAIPADSERVQPGPAASVRSQQEALGLRAVVSMAFPAGSPRTPTPEPSGAASSTIAEGDSVAVTPTPTATVAPCPGGELQVNAWPMESVHRGSYWEVQVFAEGIGGNCSYTYAWNDESDVRGEQMRGPIVFSVSSTEFGGAIVGTVVVTSGDETARMGVYIDPP
jgi:hypothetical protein